MINNINYIIKFDYEAFCRRYVENIKSIYGLTDKDVENLPLNLKTIMAWVNKVQEDDIIEHLKNDDLEYVIERIGK